MQNIFYCPHDFLRVNTSMLIPGQIIYLPGEGNCEVIFVNESRATIKTLFRFKRTVKIHKGTVYEEERTFNSGSKRMDISPNSAVAILVEAPDQSEPVIIPQQPKILVKQLHFF